MSCTSADILAELWICDERKTGWNQQLNNGLTDCTHKPSTCNATCGLILEKNCFFFNESVELIAWSVWSEHKSQAWIISSLNHLTWLTWTLAVLIKELSLFITRLMFETDLLIMSVWESYELQNQLRVKHIREKLYPKNINSVSTFTPHWTIAVL